MNLALEHCQPTVVALDAPACEALLAACAGWDIESGKLVKTFRFADYYHTIAFVNVVAWLSHQQDHHPELTVGYNTCRVAYDTHSVKGLSRNDFICAARLEAL